MIAHLSSRFFAALFASFLCILSTSNSAAAGAVRVTLQLDQTTLKVGQTTTAHVMAEIVPAEKPNTTQIFSWYVDLLNSAPTVFQIDPTTIIVPTADSDPNTSSKGTFTSGNLRAVYNSFFNTTNAGHDVAIELFSVTVKAVAVGSATLSVAAGSGAPALDHDFIVATISGDPIFGGLYDTTPTQLTSFNNVPPTIDPIANITVAEGSRASATALGHDADADQTLRYSFSGTAAFGAAVDAITGAFTWTPTEAQGPGTYTFRIKVFDNGTPVMSATNEFNVVVTEINTAPILQVPATINSAELQAISAKCNATDIDVLQGRTPSTNVLTFSLINPPAGASINPTNGAFAWTPSESQGPGNYTIKVVVVDDGTPAMAATNTFAINISEVNRAPTITAPANQTIAEGATLNVAFVAADPDLPANALTFSVVNAPPGVVLDSGTGLITWTPTEAQGPGTYTISVAVSDNAPTPLFATNSFQVTVNELNATPTLDLLPDRTVTELTPLTFTAIARDTDLPAQTLTFSLDSPPAGATINATSGAFSWTPTEAQGPGQYTIVVRVTDNGSPPRFDTKSFDVVVNEANSAPVLVTPVGQATQTVAELTPVNIQFTATDSDLPANLITFSIENAPSGATLNPASGLFSWTPSEGQGPGVYSFKIVATDNGSPARSTTNTINITVNEANTAPIIDPIDDQIVDELVKLTIPVAARDTDLPAQTLTYSLDTPPVGAAIDPVTGVFTWTPTEAQGPGQYVITVRVRESGAAALSVTRSFGVTVNEVNVAPIVQIPAPVTRVEMAAMSIPITVTDADVLNGQSPRTNRFTFTLANAPEGATINAQTGVISWTPTEAQGPASYQLRIIATDDGVPPLSGEGTLTINVSEANRLPSITAPPTQTVPELSPLNVSFTAADSDLPAQTLTFSLVAAPAGVQLNPTTGAITWTPTEAQGPGSYTISVAVADNGSPILRATNSMSVTVTEVNTKPTLAAIPDYILPVGDTIRFTATASDADIPAQTITYSLDSAPAGAAIVGSTGQFSWTPVAAQGGQQFTIVVRATESGTAALFDTKSFKISVTSLPNTAPVIASPLEQTIVAGSKLIVANTAIDSDVPANTLVFSLVAAPTGATIDAANGTFTWTPTLSQVGRTQVRVKVADNGVPSLSGTNSFFINVTAPPNTAPTILSPADQTIAAGVKLTISNIAVDSDVPVNTLTFSIAAAPSGVTVDPATGVLTWTPTSAQVGKSQIQVRVTDNGIPALSNTNSFFVTVTPATGQAAALTLVSVLTPGTTVRIDGTANASYDLLFSTNLIDWSPVTTVSLGAQTFTTYLDVTHGFGQAKGFYRAKVTGSQ